MLLFPSNVGIFTSGIKYENVIIITVIIFIIIVVVIVD